MTGVEQSIGSEPVAVAARIIVAEDDPHDQMLFGMAAEDSGLEIDFDFVSAGDELIRELERRARLGALPDVLVLDMKMPRLDGHEVLDVLAERPELRPSRVGVFSTSHRQQDIDRSRAKGAAWHEVKPSRYEDLVGFVERIVAESLAGRGDPADSSR